MNIEAKKCPKCGHENSNVYGSYYQKKLGVTVRRRNCHDCMHTWMTLEVAFDDRRDLELFLNRDHEREEIMKGEWLNQRPVPWVHSIIMGECSVCGNTEWVSSYCPNCGARMVNHE